MLGTYFTWATIFGIELFVFSYYVLSILISWFVGGVKNAKVCVVQGITSFHSFAKIKLLRINIYAKGFNQISVARFEQRVK